MTSTSVYLAPPKMERPAPKRLLSLQQPSSRPHPYPISSSPLSSPGMGGGAGALGGGGPPKRPGAPRRSHSFCGNGAATTYALASASSCSHLSSDKKHLVAPPLERTLSSIGSSGNFSPFSQQMSRPVPSSSLSPLSPPTTPGLSPLPPSSSPYQEAVPLGDVSPLAVNLVSRPVAPMLTVVTVVAAGLPPAIASCRSTNHPDPPDRNTAPPITRRHAQPLVQQLFPVVVLHLRPKDTGNNPVREPHRGGAGRQGQLGAGRRSRRRDHGRRERLASCVNHSHADLFAHTYHTVSPLHSNHRPILSSVPPTRGARVSAA
jgi:hypothetical protein